VDIVLGVSLAPTNVRLVVIEGQNADGVTVEQDEFVLAAGEPSGAVEQVIAAIDGTREGARAAGHHLMSTGVTWTDPGQVAGLRDAVAAQDLGTVMLVSPLLAGATLAQTVGQALGYDHVAMVFVEPGSATLAVVDVGDGSIVDLHRHQLAHAAGGIEAELAGMVAGLDAPGSRADGVFLVGCGTDIVPLKSALEAATSLEVTAPEEPDMALARGAALASANAPLFASTTAAMAYALDPGTGEVNPRALSPTYLDVSANAGPRADALAYSAIDDRADEEPRRRSPLVLAGGALAAASAVAAVVLAVSLTSDHPTVRHDPNAGVATPAQQPPAQAPSPPPQAQVPAPSPPPPAQAAPAAPVEQPAPPPVSVPPAAPVYRAPSPRRAPQYVPTPVQQAPAPEAPPPQPAPPPAAPPPAVPQQPQQPPMTMYLHFPFVTVPIPITPPAPPPPAP
jgi:hypothetical protein